MPNQWIAAGVVIGCGYGLLAASLGLIRQVTRFFDFSHAAVYTVAAYVAYHLSTRKVPLPMAIVGAILTAIAAGLVLHAVIFRPLQKRRATAEVLLLASLAVLIVLDNLVSLIWGDATVALPGAVAKEGFLFADARLTGPQLRIVLINGITALVLWIVVRFTPFGILLRAVSSDVELSRIRGIEVRRIVALTIAIASAAAAIAAINNAFDTDLVPMMGFNIILFAAVSLIAGGIGSVGAAFCGGLLIAFAQQLAATVLPVQWQETVAFVILIGFVFFRPTGILGNPPPKVDL